MNFKRISQSDDYLAKFPEGNHSRLTGCLPLRLHQDPDLPDWGRRDLRDALGGLRAPDSQKLCTGEELTFNYTASDRNCGWF